jgi:hypothetical protein
LLCRQEARSASEGVFQSSSLAHFEVAQEKQE